MRGLFTLSLLLCTLFAVAQSGSIIGQLQDENQQAVEFANVALYKVEDNSLVKVESSEASGIFKLQKIPAGTYNLVATFVGLADLKKENIELNADQTLDLGILAFAPKSVELTEATVTASRVMVEIKPDRTVFNVDGTINSTGDNAMTLMRKAPGVLVDNNDNINVLGRSGVLIYIDGKRLPLSGQDLTDYLSNLPSDQIDRIDIITNPGAKYEAEGNAGIIDIRLKKDKSLGANGSIRGTFSQGQFAQSNLNFTGNYRNKAMNVFGTLGLGQGESFNSMVFQSTQNDVYLDESNYGVRGWNNNNYRLGADFYLGDKSIIGILATGGYANTTSDGDNRIAISPRTDIAAIDSILVAESDGDFNNDRNTYNINYRFDDRKAGKSLNVDLDYGTYRNAGYRYQPNRYYNATEEAVLSEIINAFDTRTDIDIYTFTADYEQNLYGGKLGFGTKFSKVVSDNTFLQFDEVNGQNIQNDTFSNIFLYDENVYAGYVNYARKINDKWSFSAGVRAEQTDALGDLTPFLAELTEDPVDLNYLQFFPSAGLTWQLKPTQVINFNYGRRINRPDYNVLNPFNNRLSQLSYERGNPRLNPEIVNNVEIGYTLNYRYNFKIAYSKTTDQITRLIAPDEVDPRANFISWANLAEQDIFSANISAPMQLAKKWNAYFNLSASHINNQADYGNGAVVDVQTFTYSIYQQHTFDLPWKLKGEISGYFAGPGVWGGVFLYETSWALNVGLQRKFLENKMNVRISFNDIFYESGWDGFSDFNGLYSAGSGRWDSRRFSVSVGYNFGNENVKSRNRKAGLEKEAERVGG